MEDQNSKKDKDIRNAERAVNRAFSTGKADRAAITRQAQLDAAEAVAMAGVAMESDEAADEADRLAIIAASMGNRQKAKDAKERARIAHKQAKTDHAAATKSARRAFDAIRFSDPTKLGFMRVVQLGFLFHIIGTLAVLIFTSRDTVVYSAVSILDWIMVVLEGVAFYFFVNRFKIGRPFVMGMAALGIVANVINDIVKQQFSFLSILGSIGFYIFLLLYFLLSTRVKAVLVNDLSTDKGFEEENEFVIDRHGWPFYRNLGIYFVIFSVLGHWMEAGMCQFIRLGWVQGEYDPSNTMLWRDWLYPYPMEGAAVVIIALLLYPMFLWLKKRFSNRIVPYVISFFANALTCTIIEFIGGIMFNANLQNWNYSDMPFNFMGQVCLQNAVAFGVAASLIAWYVYPALERFIARVRPAFMNIVFVIVIVAGGILFSLYAISPPDGIDLGEGNTTTEIDEAKAEAEGLAALNDVAETTVDAYLEKLGSAEHLTDEQRQSIQDHLNTINTELDALENDLAA